MCLRTKSVDYTDSFRAKKDSLGDLRGKSISSLRKDDFGKFLTHFGFIDENFQARTYTRILIDREKYSIDRLQCLDDSKTICFILKRFYSTFELCLMVIIHYDPEFISSGFRFREFETFDMPWMKRVGIHRCDSEDSHRGLEEENIQVLRRDMYLPQTSLL